MDRDHLGRVRDGDSASAHDLYARVCDSLYSYCASVCVDDAAAQAAASDAFLLACGRLGQLRDAHELSTWLLAIARNECLRDRSKRARENVFERLGERDVDDCATAESACEASQEIVREALELLGSADRELLNLSVAQDLEVEEISRIVGCSTRQAATKRDIAESHLESGVATLLLFRSHPLSCEGLVEAIGPDQALTPLARQRIAKHTTTCRQCEWASEAARNGIARHGVPGVAAPDTLGEELFGPSVQQEAQLGDSAAGGYAVGPRAAGVTAINIQSDQLESGDHANSTIYVRSNAAPPLPFAARSAQLDRARPPFDRHGWPRRPNPLKHRIPLIAGVSVVVMVMCVAAALAILG